MPVRKAIYAHAQGFMLKDELLLLILTTFAQCALSLHTNRNV